MIFIRDSLTIRKMSGVHLFLSLMVLAVVAFLACKKTETVLSQSESLKIDSVLLGNFTLLDSVASNLYDSTGKTYPMGRLQEVAMTMYDITGISANKGGSDIGLLFVDSVEVRQWRVWFKENRDLLRWDSVSQSIIVEDLHQDL